MDDNDQKEKLLQQIHKSQNQRVQLMSLFAELDAASVILHRELNTALERYEYHLRETCDVFTKLDIGNYFHSIYIGHEWHALQSNESVDFRNDDGKYVLAKVTDKSNTKLQINGASIDCVAESNRFAKPGSVSGRPAHRLRHLNVGDGAKVNALHNTKHHGSYLWIPCQIVQFDEVDSNINYEFSNTKTKQYVKRKSGQIQVSYVLENEHHMQWV
eukprot:166569_1